MDSIALSTPTLHTIEEIRAYGEYLNRLRWAHIDLTAVPAERPEPWGPTVEEEAWWAEVSAELAEEQDWDDAYRESLFSNYPDNLDIDAFDPCEAAECGHGAAAFGGGE